MLETEEMQSGRAERLQLPSEVLVVRSGKVLLIDQFMLGNSQFLSAVADGRGEQAVADFGGTIVSAAPGRWRAYRLPRERAFFLLPEAAAGEEPDETLLLHEIEESSRILSSRLTGQTVEDARGLVLPGRVYVETRCVVFVDWELLQDNAIMREYLELRQNGKDKEARDFLRERGAAVRYGFSQESDQLGIVMRPGSISLLAI